MFTFEPANYIENEPKDSVFFVIFDQSILSFSNENFIRPLTQDELTWSYVEEKERHFLGYLNKQPCFVILAEKNQCELEHSIFIDMRSALGRMPDQLFDVIARSIQIITWSKDHQYCGSCGSLMHRHSKERAMECPNCKGQLIYPRISPCVITLIYRENEFLLAHNKNFPPNFYSTLAGFIEPGESVESALKREVKEEVDINIKNLKYFSSQAWPFPSQLMLGFYAEYDSGELKPDGDEIDDAQWFTVESMPTSIPPANISISGKLIENFINKS